VLALTVVPPAAHFHVRAHMKRWHRVVALALAIVLINAATQMVTSANQAVEAYPPDGDTIAIPIFSTFFLSLIVAPWLLLLACFSRFKVVRALFSSGGIRSAIVIAGLVLLYAPACFLAVGGIEYWAIPRHYEIATAFAVSLLVLIVLAWDDLRTLRSNFAHNTDAKLPRFS
jgi:hypothetical protein